MNPTEVKSQQDIIRNLEEHLQDLISQRNDIEIDIRIYDAQLKVAKRMMDFNPK